VPSITLPALSTTTHRLVEGQETAFSSFEPSMSRTVHDEAAPVGWVELTTSPDMSTASHNLVEGQETAFSVDWSTLCTVHDEAAPVGRVEVTTSPALSTATHSVVEGQEIAFSWFALSTLRNVHDEAPPDGSVVTARSLGPTPMQNRVEGQAIELGAQKEEKEPLNEPPVQDGAPPVGSVEVSMKLWPL
jgi:hypothetical protein